MIRYLKQAYAFYLYRRSLAAYNDAKFFRLLAEQRATDAIEFERQHTVTRLEIATQN